MPHEELREWLRENNLHFKDLAREVGARNLSYYTKGRLFPPDYIKVWQRIYGWSDEQAFTFQYDRPFKRTEFPVSDKQTLVLKAFKEILEGV